MSDFQGHLEYTYKEVTYVIWRHYTDWIYHEKEDGGENCSTWPTGQISLEEIFEELRCEVDDA